jgi:hypothetical protein
VDVTCHAGDSEVCLTNCYVVLGSLELPESDIDGDTTLTLSLQLVEDPCVLEGTLAEFGGFLYGESVT